MEVCVMPFEKTSVDRVLVVAVFVVAVGCGSSSNPASPMTDASTTSDATGTAAESGSGGGDGSVGDGGSTLYTRLGGHAGIRAAVDAIVAAELADPEMKTYFFNQVAVPVPVGHPTADQLEECLTDQLANAAGGPEAFPTTVTTDAGAFACRGDMTLIHTPLKISGGTFDKFVMIAGGVLTSAMGTAPYTYTTADIATVAGVLVSTKPAIVDPHLADAGFQAFPGPDAQ
jgi:hypothetical protein